MPINPVVIQTPNDATVESLRDAMVGSDYYSNLFDSGDLRLFLSPSEYKRTTEGESSKWITGYASNVVMHAARRVGLELSITDARSEIMRLLQAIARWSQQNSKTVTLRDYCYLEDDTAHAVGYTVRQGIITQIEANGGSVRRDSTLTSVRYGGGFRLVFWEKDLREYF